MRSGVYPQHCLIGTALATSQTGELRVDEIYKMVKILFPFVVMTAPSSWKNSLRHSLSNSGYFEMVNKSTHPVLAAKKNHKWRINQARANDLLRNMEKHNRKIAANNTVLIGSLAGSQASIVAPSLQQQLITDPTVQSQVQPSLSSAGSQFPLSLPGSTVQNDIRQAPLIIRITTPKPAIPTIDVTASMKKDAVFDLACPIFEETTSTTTTPFVESTPVTMTPDDSIPSLCMDFSPELYDISSEKSSSDISEAPTFDTDDCLSESCQETLLVTSQQLEELMQQSSDDQWLQDVDLNTLITPDTSDEAMSTVLSSTSEIDNDSVIPSHAFDILEDLKLDEEDVFVDITPSSSDSLLEEKDNLIEDLLECLIITGPRESILSPDDDNDLSLSDAFCTANNHTVQQMPENKFAILNKETEKMDKWISDRWNKFRHIASREQFRKNNSSYVTSKKFITESVSKKRPRDLEMATMESAKRQKTTDITPGGQTVRKHSRTRLYAPVRQTGKCMVTTSIDVSGTYSQKHCLQDDAAVELLPLKRPRFMYSLRK